MSATRRGASGRSTCTAPSSAAAWTFRQQLHTVDERTLSFAVAAVDAGARVWRDDDQGIWEFRGPPRPFLHSKLMCWVTLDRGVRLVEDGLLHTPHLSQWIEVRDTIRAAIQDEGWNDRVGAFTQSFGSDELDPSALLVGIVGFLPAHDPRLLATIDRIESTLSDDRCLLYRYRGSDGFDEPEGTFLLRTFWLAQALALTGQTGRARAILARATAHVSELGLLAEQVDPTWVSCWATSRRRSATSGWFSPPGGSCPRPAAVTSDGGGR